MIGESSCPSGYVTCGSGCMPPGNVCCPSYTWWCYPGETCGGSRSNPCVTGVGGSQGSAPTVAVKSATTSATSSTGTVSPSSSTSRSGGSFNEPFGAGHGAVLGIVASLLYVGLALN
jgi:hypothetical protein